MMLQLLYIKKDGLLLFIVLIKINNKTNHRNISLAVFIDESNIS